MNPQNATAATRLQASYTQFSSFIFGQGTYSYKAESLVVPTGWHKWGSSWWWMEYTGSFKKGWHLDGSIWYWLDETSGAMWSNAWLSKNGNWYYLKPGGAMAVGNRVWVEKDGRYANFSSSGVWLGYV